MSNGFSKAQQNWIPAFAGMTMLLIGFAFSGSLSGLWGAWQSDEYSHGVLIPLLAAFLGWHRLAEVKPPLRASWLGVFALVLAGVGLVLGRLSAFAMIEQYALALALLGLCLAFLGRAASLAMAPALFYLLFAIPLPNMVQANLSQELQLLSSTLGVWPLKAFGLSVFQEGNVIDLGGYSLQVVDACSGLRYIFPLMSFGYLIAFLYKGAFWKRGVLFLATIPIAIFMNALRIAAVGASVNFWGIAMAEGVLHEFEGWVVFSACVALLALLGWALGGRLNWDYVALPPRLALPIDAAAPRRAPMAGALLVAALLAVLMQTGAIENRAEIIPPHKPLALFPLQMEGWQGRSQEMEAAIARELKLSDYWIADYARAGASGQGERLEGAAQEPPVNLYIAHYDSQRAGVITHTPASCIPGGGWQIEARGTRTVPIGQGETLKVSRILARRGGAAILVYYWFDQRGRTLTESYEVKGYLLLDSLLHKRSDGALIRLVTALGEGESETAADARLEAFLRLARPSVRAYLPENLFQ